MALALFCTQTEARNWNQPKIESSEVIELPTRKVPSDFPLYSASFDQECEQGSRSWRDRLTLSWTENFLWGAQFEGGGVRIFSGERTNRRVFSIRVSSASRKVSTSNWLNYTIKNRSLTEILASETVKSDVGFGKTCTIKLNGSVKLWFLDGKASESEQLGSIKAKLKELEKLNNVQTRAISIASIFGRNATYRWGFLSARDRVKTKLSELSALSEKNSDSRRKDHDISNFNNTESISITSLGDQELCQIIKSSIVELAHIKELAERRLICGESGKVAATGLYEATPNQTKKERRATEAEATQKRVEEERRLAEAEVARKRVEQERRLAEAAVARKRAEEERRAVEAEAARKRAEEERRAVEAEAARKRAEEERRVAEAEAARKRVEEEGRVAEAEAARKQAEAEMQRLLADKEKPSIELTQIRNEGALGTITGTVNDDGKVDLFMINGQRVALDESGNFSFEIYIPRRGIPIELFALDETGKQTIQTVELSRGYRRAESTFVRNSQQLHLLLNQRPMR